MVVVEYGIYLDVELSVFGKPVIRALFHTIYDDLVIGLYRKVVVKLYLTKRIFGGNIRVAEIHFE